MTIDSLVNNVYAANIRVVSSIDGLEQEEQREIESHPEYKKDKAKAVADFLNNFYFRLPGGFFVDLISKAVKAREDIGEDTILGRKRLREYMKVADNVRESLLESGLSLEESTTIAGLEPVEQKKYLFGQDNFYRLMPIMLEAYIALRKKGYKREELVS